MAAAGGAAAGAASASSTTGDATGTRTDAGDDAELEVAATLAAENRIGACDGAEASGSASREKGTAGTACKREPRMRTKSNYEQWDAEGGGSRTHRSDCQSHKFISITCAAAGAGAPSIATSVA